MELHIRFITRCNWTGASNRSDTQIIAIRRNHEVWTIALGEWSMAASLSLWLHLQMDENAWSHCVRGVA